MLIGNCSHLNFTDPVSLIVAQIVGRLCETALIDRRLAQTPYNYFASFHSRPVLRKKFKNAFLVCATNPAFSNQPGYQPARSHVERIIRSRT